MQENDSIETLKEKIRTLEEQNSHYAEIEKRLEITRKDLSTSVNLLSNIVDGNPIPTFILDRNHVVIYWNQTFEKISGISADQIIGTTDPWKAFYKKKRPVMADLIIDGVDEKVFWAHYQRNSEYTTLRRSSLKEGAYESQDFFPDFGENGMWLYAYACPLTDEDGNIIGAIQTFQDITKLCDSQKESKKNEEKYRSLFENAGDAFFLMDFDRLIDCNALSLKLFNCSHEDLLGHSIFDFFPKVQKDGSDSKEEFEIKIKSAYEGAIPRFYWRFYGLFGKAFDANVTLSRVEVHGRYVVQVVVRDISKHVKTEHELSRLRTYLVSVINSMPSILVGVDDKGRITHWNLKAEQEAGLKSSAVSGKKLSSICPRLKGRMEKIISAIQDKKVYEETKIANEKNGEIRFENLTVYPLSGESINEAVIRLDDVTDQVQMEEMMIQSEKMMSVGSLAAGMAHEINNPLAGMMQNAQVIVNRLSQDLPANRQVAQKLGLDLDLIGRYMKKREIIDLARMINESGGRAAKIIRNMLSFSRKSESNKSHHMVTHVLDKTIEIAGSDYDLKTDYDFKQIEIERVYDPETPSLFCDESKMQQVFWNILKNGAEAMQKTKRKSKFIIRVFPLEDTVCIEIEDNGPGMAPNTQKRLFEPFFTTKGADGGTGLGLAVAYFIVSKDHGGKIRIESEKGSGSTFAIELNQ